jgi:sortase A
MKLLGTILIFISVGITLFIFGPVLKEEVKYKFDQISKIQYKIGGEQLSTFEKVLTPPNEDFSIVIPKIAAVAPIIANVDSQNQKVYLSALRKGVAHAKGTSFPGTGGNTYLFAHSTDAFYNVSQYNAIFYLIGKLNPGDKINVFYRGVQYEYEVYDKKVVKPESVEYLGKIDDEETLTLQTCYPPGTAIKRLVVVARRVTN